jgi:two-component system LytT family response regulator
MFTCYIIDDEKFSIDCVTNEIKKIPELQLIGYNTNPLLALNEIQKGLKPDIIFLDIEMPELSGLDVVKLLPQDTAIIIRTAFAKHAHNAFDLDAVDFLLKPYKFERFLKAIKKAKIFLQKDNSCTKIIDFNRMFINSNIKGRINQIIFSEIIYIEALDHTLYIHTDREVYMTRQNLKDIEEKLPSTTFIRVHRAFIVNIDLLKSFDANGMTMSNGKVIPCVGNYRQLFRDKIKFKTSNRSL